MIQVPNMKKMCLMLLAFGLMAGLMFAVQAQTPAETLKQCVADLQTNPNDTALREKIIKLAQTIKPAPAIPEEAREHYVMAETFVKKAQDKTGFDRAIEQYQAALLAAPWWPEAYKKLAIVQKAAARYDEAIASLNLYLLTQPPDARNAQDEIYVLKAEKQTAADDQARKQGGAASAQTGAATPGSSPQAVAAQEQNSFEDWLKKLNGARYTRTVFSDGYKFVIVLDVSGTTLISGTIFPQNHAMRGYRRDVLPSVEIRSREPTVTFKEPSTGQVETHGFVITENGDKITHRKRSSDGEVREVILLREH
jgi:hypothetical protein